MRFFIIGNPSSVWLKEYIKHIHIKQGHEVCVTVFDTSKLQFVDEYKKMGVQFIALGKNQGKFKKIIKFFRLFLFAYKNRNKKFDIMEIQSPPHNIQAFALGMIARLMDCKTFLMFWGSDILAINTKEAKKLEHVIKHVDVINRPGRQPYEKFIDFYGNKYQQLFTPFSLRFGTLALPWIDKIQKEMNVSDCKKKINIPINKTSVAIGYNGQRRQQHVQVIESLGKMTEDLKHKIHLILHFAGCEDVSYVGEVKKLLDKYKFSYTCIEKNLEFNDIAVLRMATDIFIHAQKTDGLSGSIRECLYSNTLVINPAWIKYDELKKLNVEYLEYNDFNELRNIVVECLLGQVSVDLTRNKKIIGDYYSWDVLTKEWNQVFSRMI